MTIETYLMFKGDCREAFGFYQTLLGGTIEAMLPFADAPTGSPVPEEWLTKIMHARLVVNGRAIVASDAPPGHQQAPAGFHVSISLKSIAEAERIFNGLSDGAQHMAMPLGETFWAKRFGMVTDRFGIPWMINGEG